jgi:hypothetical protein
LVDSTKPGDAKPCNLDQAAVDVGASLRPWHRKLSSQGHPRRVWWLEAGVVVAGYVKQRDVEAADQVFEVVEWKIPAAEHDVRPDWRQLIAVEALLDLVRDGEDAQTFRRA